MFDCTGVVEVFVHRFRSGDMHSPEHGGSFPTPERLMACVSLTERFDWMGDTDVVIMTIALDGTDPSSFTTCITKSECAARLPEPIPDVNSPPFTACFQALHRVALRSTVLCPVDSNNWPPEANEAESSGKIRISLRRGYKERHRRPAGGKTEHYFRRASGPAGVAINMTFAYRSRYLGHVELTSTATYFVSSLPDLAFTRSPESIFSKRARSVTEEEEEGDPPGASDNGASAKRARLYEEPASDSPPDDDEYHDSTALFWSEET